MYSLFPTNIKKILSVRLHHCNGAALPLTITYHYIPDSFISDRLLYLYLCRPLLPWRHHTISLCTPPSPSSLISSVPSLRLRWLLWLPETFYCSLLFLIPFLFPVSIVSPLTPVSRPSGHLAPAAAFLCIRSSLIIALLDSLIFGL